MILKTNRGAEYQVSVADHTLGQLNVLILETIEKIGKIATDLDGVETFFLFDEDSDSYEELTGYDQIITIVRQTDTSYFITIKRSDA